jgi:RNA polymerase sigma factor (sigma-70 family)
MSKEETPKARSRSRRTISDTYLVRACLKGDEKAWSSLVDKYKNLIFSIPIKYGLTPDEAADIFQSVCLELLRDLPQLREPRALPAWLIRITSHKCFHWKKKQQKLVTDDRSQEELSNLQEPHAGPDDLLSDLEREQTLRDAVAELDPRCRKLVKMLFTEIPPRPYTEVAKSLGVAKGSIGFIRGRCLDRLKRALLRRGFE